MEPRASTSDAPRFARALARSAGLVLLVAGLAVPAGAGPYGPPPKPAPKAPAVRPEGMPKLPPRVPNAKPPGPGIGRRLDLRLGEDAPPADEPLDAESRRIDAHRRLAEIDRGLDEARKKLRKRRDDLEIADMELDPRAPEHPDDEWDGTADARRYADGLVEEIEELEDDIEGLEIERRIVQRLLDQAERELAQADREAAERDRIRRLPRDAQGRPIVDGALGE